MPQEHWSIALVQPAPDAEAALALLPHLLGPVHRLAWTGEDEYGDRRRAVLALQRIVGPLTQGHVALVSVLDWWMVAALGEKSCANAWDIEREVGLPTGARLQEVLQIRGERPLAALRRPLRLAQALVRLEDLAGKHSGKIAPAVRILKEAASDCNALLAAARENKPPPKGLRLSNLSQDAMESWAGEVQGGRSITPGTPVWEHVTRSLRERADLVDEALRLWSTKPPPKIELQPGWERDIEVACTPHHELAIALVADLLPETPDHPALRPNPAPFGERPPALALWAAFGLAREAFSSSGTEPTEWMKAAGDQLDALLEETHRLRTSAKGAHVAYVDEATTALGVLDIATAREWLATAREEVGKASQDAAMERGRVAAQELQADLAAQELQAAVAGEEPRTDPAAPAPATPAPAPAAPAPASPAPTNVAPANVAPTKATPARAAPAAASAPNAAALATAAATAKAAAAVAATSAELADALAAVSEMRKRISRRIDDAADLLALLNRSAGVQAGPHAGVQTGPRAGPLAGILAGVHADIAAARIGLSRSLEAGLVPLARAEAKVAEARVADDARLGPELAALRDRLRARPDRAGFLELLDLAANRLAANLDPAPVARDIEATLAQKEPAAVAVENLKARELRRLAYVPAAVHASGTETRTRVRVRGVWVCGGTPEAAERVRAWGEAGASPSPECDGTRFYVVEKGTVTGPFRNEGDTFVPDHVWEAVGVFPVVQFRSLFGAVDLPDGRFLVPYPPTLEELLSAGADVIDEMDDTRLATWLARELDGAPAAERIARWLQDAASLAVPTGIREARFERMSGLLGRARQLESLKVRAVTGFLTSERGQGAISDAVSAAAEAAVRRDEARIRAVIAAKQATLEVDLHTAESRLAEVQAELADADSLLADRRLALFARFAGGGAAPASPASPASPATAETSAPTRGLASAPIRAGGFDAAPLPPLAEVVRLVAGDTWGQDEVANLLVSVLTGRWTLLAGFPGVGKSTFVRSVLSRLGHGPGSSRFLELVVRRDWQDDTPLFGFWHPTHHAWEASSEGFVEHLLRAGDDHANGYGGVYPVLVEELNLASPEYYLARPISALEAAHPTVRLYDPELTPANAARYPSTFAVPDSVRLLGTVNVDDTVERLSPRFLSRTSVLWVEPTPGGQSWHPDSDAPRLTARWDALTTAMAGPVGDLGDVERLLRLLADRRVPGAPTARTRAAISRYLGASRGVLQRKQAEDYQILQRVLPPLRGVGPRWRALLDEVGALLKQNGWTRSAARTLDLRERGEELGDWYDFFHT